MICVGPGLKPEDKFSHDAVESPESPCSLAYVSQSVDTRETLAKESSSHLLW